MNQQHMMTTVRNFTVLLAAIASIAFALCAEARLFHTEHGRWTRRDPLGYVDGGNLYEYAESAPVESIDPFGLCVSPMLGDDWKRSIQTQDEVDAANTQACCEWWNDSIDDSWLQQIPQCPCTEDLVPSDWSRDWWFIRDRYHPGASQCYRSPRGTNGANQQCCYDAQGRLITWGEAAGTPDKNEPGGHRREDVIPFENCRDAGMIGCYLDRRPPSVVPCLWNPVNAGNIRPCPCDPRNYVEL